jgi:hypothetical protein
MEFMNQAWEQVATYINVPYLLIFIMLSYLVKRYFGTMLQKITKFHWQTVYTVLIIATLTAAPFLIWVEGTTWVKVLFTYALGTSLHELLFRYLEKLWNKAT